MKTFPTALCTPSLVVLLASLATGCGDDGSPHDSVSAGETTSDTDTGTSASATMPSSMTSPDSTDGSTTDDATTRDSSSGDDETATAGACAVTPGDWSAPDWEDHVGTEVTLRAALADLVGAPLMRGAETGDVSISSLADLTGPFEAGTPSLASVTHAGFEVAVMNSLEEFFDAIEAGPNDLMSEGLWAPGDAGGIWGDSDRGINEGGIEVRQIVDKGMFGGGAFVHHALLLTEGTLDAETIDRLAYIWGNNADLDPADENAPLRNTANYSFRQGFHADMAAALTAAKAYAEDPECDAERDEAIVEFFRLWETSVMSRVVYYINQMAVRLTTASTQDDFAEALHQLAEGLGLAAGFHGLPDPRSGPLAGAGRLITDDELDEILDALGFDMNDQGASTTGTFVESLPAFEDAQSAAEAVMRDTYGVDQATIATWRTPTSG
jgi:hypothetical protein